MEWVKERWATVRDAAGIRWEIFGLLVALAIGRLDWIYQKYLEFTKQPSLGDEMIFGFPSWIVGLTVLLGFLSWWFLEYSVKLRRQINQLNTPSVSIDLLKVEEDMLKGKQIAFLEVTGLSATPVRVEVFAASVTSLCEGDQGLYRQRNHAQPFTLHRGESHQIYALTYDTHDISSPFRVSLPCKIPVTDTINGSEFSILVHGYGGAKTAELEFHCGITDEGALWIQKVGTTKRLISDIRVSLLPQR